MKWLFVLTALTICSTSGELLPPERPYKILMLLPISTQSHRNTFVPLARALADRGHKVVMLTNNNKERIVTENIHEFTHGIEELNIDNYNMFKMKGEPRANVHTFEDLFSECVEKLYANGEINELYRKRKMFDLIVIDAILNEIMYPFAHEMPFITIAPAGVEVRHGSQMGNPMNPSYISFSHSSLSFPMDLMERIWNLSYHLGFAFYWDVWMTIPFMQKQLVKKFPNLPSIVDIERNQSLTLSNSHFSMGSAVPLLPSQVEVGGMHCRKAEPLPQDLKDWIEGAGKAGVIYFSLGSFIRSSSMPDRYRAIIFEAFSRLHQRVIWKFEEDLPNVPANVLVRSWLPQQDILGHPKVKVFITHGGLLSFQEAVYHATPVVLLPISMDQPKNARIATAKGIGISIPWEDLNSADQLVDALLTIFQNANYQDNMDEMSTSFRDQLHPPLDRAIYWAEYVIRHQGAPVLKSPAARLTWVEFLLLDVIVVLLLAIGIVFFVSKIIVKRLFSVLRRKMGAKDDFFSLPLSSKEKLN